jgi:hypothetical protein
LICRLDDAFFVAALTGIAKCIEAVRYLHYHCVVPITVLSPLKRRDVCVNQTQYLLEVFMISSKSWLGILIVPLMALALNACSTNDGPVSPQAANDNPTSEAPSFMKVGRAMVWADCELFATVVTPATFKPSSTPFDELYATGNFKDGVPLISESKPGDQDYNGGRWHMNALKSTVSPTKYANACSVEELDLNDFMSTDMYFECPLLPRRGNK